VFFAFTFCLSISIRTVPFISFLHTLLSLLQQQWLLWSFALHHQNQQVRIVLSLLTKNTVRKYVLSHRSSYTQQHQYSVQEVVWNVIHLEVLLLSSSFLLALCHIDRFHQVWHLECSIQSSDHPPTPGKHCMHVNIQSTHIPKYSSLSHILPDPFPMLHRFSQHACWISERCAQVLGLSATSKECSTYRVYGNQEYEQTLQTYPIAWPTCEMR